MSDTRNDQGRFVWYELLTTEPDAAKAFYPEVIGWKPQPFEGGIGPYTMWVGDQGPLGGVAELPEVALRQGAQPYWQANVHVDDIDAAIAKVKRLGGKVYVSEDVPSVGRIAVVADPQGAVISLFTPATAMAAHDANRPGEFCWHELYTSDLDAGWSFYQELFGWEQLGSMDMGAMGEYRLWGRGGVQLGGMMKLPPGMKTPAGQDVPPSWMYYVAVADLDAALERAKARGAIVINGPMPVPGGQRIVQLLDPQGAAFALATVPTAA